MDLGNKILELRKKMNMSQEVLAEKVGVSRQTISKWELNETSPDIKEAKKLSNIFHVSLDELVGNDVNSVLVEKVSNTERLAGIIITILKVLGVLFIVWLVLIVLAIILFAAIRRESEDSGQTIHIVCTLDNDDYEYTIESDKVGNIESFKTDDKDNIFNVDDYNTDDDLREDIVNYYEEKDAMCEVYVERMA